MAAARMDIAGPAAAEAHDREAAERARTRQWSSSRCRDHRSRLRRRTPRRARRGKWDRRPGRGESTTLARRLSPRKASATAVSRAAQHVPAFQHEPAHVFQILAPWARSERHPELSAAALPGTFCSLNSRTERRPRMSAARLSASGSGAAGASVSGFTPSSCTAA